MEAHGAVSGGNPGVLHEDLHNRPALAAIVVAPDSYNTIRRLMECLKAQTVAGQIEVVLVTPSTEQLAVEESDLACFQSWQVVEVGSIRSFGAAYAEGIVRAKAPVVALTHDHSFPDVKWGELLIAAHRERWAAVGPSIRNGNPDSIVSWADFYVCYGEWSHPVTSGRVHRLPADHSSYKRDILLASETPLRDLMEDEYFLHGHLEAQGYGLLLESGTSSSHINLAAWSTWIPSRYYKGRHFAGTWAREWLWPRRLLYGLASPVIPLIRLWRIQKRIRRGQTWRFLVTVLPVVALGLTVECFGEVLGFVAGPGNAGEKFTHYEFGRLAPAGAPGPRDRHDSPAK